MDFIFTQRFKKFYKNLSDKKRKALRKKLDLMSMNPDHPSLRIKKIQGADGVFECTINMAVRMTWQYDDGSILLRVVGDRDIVLKNP